MFLCRIRKQENGSDLDIFRRYISKYYESLKKKLKYILKG